MNVISWADSKIKRLNVYDIGLIKVTSVFVGIIIGSFCSKRVRKIWPVFAAMAALTSIPILFKILFDKQNT